MAPRLTPEARALIQRQRGVIAAWQLGGVGLTPRQVRQARGRDWHSLTPRTLLAAHTDPTAAQLRVAGVLEAGPDAALTGCSALIEAGWTGSDDGHVDVTVVRGHRSRHLSVPAWLRVHTTTEVPRRGGIPARVSPARAAIDAAVWARTPRERMFVLASAVQQRLVTPRQLRGELTRRSRLRHTREVHEILDDLEIGVTSSNEAEFLRHCRARGLPAPRMQVRRVARGKRRRIDAEFPLADGRVVIVEIDGAGHLDIAQWQADLVRQNELAVGTPRAIILHVTGWQVRHDPDPFFDLLAGLVLPSM